MYFPDIKTSLRSIIWIATLTVIAGCGLGKKLSKSGNEKFSTDFSNMTEAQFKEALYAKQVNAEWWQAKAKIHANIDGEPYTLQANLKIKSGKFIWVSLRKLGLEVARIYITPDSAVVLNRIDGTYQVENNDTAIKQLGFPIRSEMLEDLALGKPIIPEKIKLPEKAKDGQFFVLGESEEWTNQMIFSTSEWHLEQIDFKLKNSETALSAKFSQYQPIKDNKYISYLRVYEFKDSSDAPSVVEMLFSDIQPDMPFETVVDIPSRYKRI